MSRRRRTLALVFTATASAACGDGELHAFAVSAAADSGAAGQAQGGTSGAGVLLDDFEDQNNHAPGDGWWYSTDDGTADSTSLSFELAADRSEGQYAARLRGGPTTEYGAFLGLDLPGGVYDASGFATLCFFGRANPPMELSVQLLDSLFVHYGVSVDLQAGWQEYCPAIADFVADGEVLDPASLVHLQFWAQGPGPAFDFWIDDVTLRR